MLDIDLITINALERIRQQAPLIHNITNFVVMETTANILLATGASPVMAHCRGEVEEMVSLAQALVLNIGTIQQDWLESMIRAAQQANKLGIPVILDPVGAGATQLRTMAVQKIMSSCSIAVLRGNASEVLSLLSADVRTRGVDSSLALSDEGIQSARALARTHNCVVAISGAQDCITDGKRVLRVHNGHPIMTRVTGVGCGLSAVTAAFCAAADGDPTLAATAAFAFYGLCGELAVKSSEKPGGFYVAFLDRLYDTGAAQIKTSLKVLEA